MSALHSRRAFVSTAALAALGGCLGREVPYAASSDDDSTQFPPGVSEDGVDDAEALLSAHRDRLLSGGFAAELRVEGESGPEIDYAVESGADGTPLSLSGTVENGDGTVAVDVWTTASRRVTRRDSGDGPRYRGGDRVDGVTDRFVVLLELRDAVEAGAFAVEGTDDRDGTTVATLVAEAFDADEIERFHGLDAATLVVDERGVVRETTLELADETDGTETVSYEVTEVGTGDPAEPAWLSEAPESAFDHFEVHVDPTSGDALAVENRGDDPVPAGTTVTVHDGDATYSTDLAGPIEPDAEVYFSIQEGSLSASDERPSAVDESFTPSITVSIVSPDDVTISESSMSWGSSSASESSDSTGSSGSSAGSSSASGSDDSDDE